MKSPRRDLGRTISRVLGGAALLGAVAVGAFAVVGPARVWDWFGAADLGPVDFATLQRRATGNDALACPDGLCGARADQVTALYPVPAVALRQAFSKAIAGEPRVTIVAADEAALTDRYIQRTALMGFPDTIVVQYFDRPGGQSTLALSSRSRFGKGDMGVNRARVARWLALLAAQVPPLP